VGYGGTGRGRKREIIRGKRAIATDTALRLAIYFGTTPEFWLNLQTHHDLKLARRTLLPTIKKDIRPFAP
jgi:addiction module HigA family antidote